MRPLTVVCGSPLHAGDRLVARADAVERRIEFRRLNDAGRASVLLDRLVCRDCMRTEVRERRGSGYENAGPELFGGGGG